MKSIYPVLLGLRRRRPPRGGRGLKLSDIRKIEAEFESPPSRGAWIEIRHAIDRPAAAIRRPPRGGRGLKFSRLATTSCPVRSPPSRGAWIEIGSLLKPRTASTSPPSRGAWIEMQAVHCGQARQRCRPPRGGRGLKLSDIRKIEAEFGRPPRGGRGLKYLTAAYGVARFYVAPLAGGVD